MSNKLIYTVDGQSKLLYSTTNRLVFAMPEETLFLEFFHYNSDEHPSNTFGGGDCYHMEDDLLEYPDSTPDEPEWVRHAFQSSGSDSTAYRDVFYERTKVNLKDGDHNGLQACDAGTFSYDVVMWSILDTGTDQRVGHNENVYLTAFIGVYNGYNDISRGVEESNTKHIVSIPTFEVEDGEWKDVPPFPTPACHVATVHWNPETRELSIS